MPGTRYGPIAGSRPKAFAHAASLTVDDPLRDVLHATGGSIAWIHPLEEVAAEPVQIVNWFNVNGTLSAGNGPGDTRKPFGEFNFECRP